jgi:hypothetical protein
MPRTDSPRGLKPGAALVALAGVLGLGHAALERAAAAQEKGAEAPIFEVDPFWPKPLPNHWLLGSAIGVTVDDRDHVFIVHRGGSSLNERTEMGAATSPKTAEACCVPAPPVLEFDAAGNLVGNWGGPGEGYEWPESNHGITIDHKGYAWIGGNGRNDAHVLKFTRDGKFLMQYGKQGRSGGSHDAANFGRVAKIFVDPASNEAYFADGYGNKRVAVIDADSGALKRYWGAYGNKPDDTNLGPYDPDAPPAQQFRNPVHCAELSRDGLLYVCDRPNNRIQVFRKDGSFVKEAFVARRTLGDGAVWDIAFSKLEGPRRALALPRRRQEREGLRDRAPLARDRDELRRRRPPAGPVLRRAQHRDRLEGQHLHHRDLRGEAAAEVRLQGARPGDAQGPGPALAARLVGVADSPTS